jgi:DNA-binding NtrC family response regulator
MIFTSKINILLIEDEEFDVRRVRKTIQPLQQILNIQKVAADGETALKFLKSNKSKVDVVVMDFQIVGNLTGESLIKKIKELDPTVQIIVITKMTINVTDFDFANALLQAGAMWYCTKYPVDIEEFIYQPTDFILSIINAYEKSVLEKKEKISEKKLISNVTDILEDIKIIGESNSLKVLKQQIIRAASQEATVLITGESGTGKELVARHIHYISKRKFEKFITINSGSLPAELIESELYGFEKGAFTGANQSKPGLFEMAHNGSIFLDEIAELPLPAQSKLLRVLQDGEIDKIGRIDKLKVNVRVIAATNKNLADEIKNKNFRQDLFYRLNVVTIHVPPLRDRRDDIPLLLEHFLTKFCAEMSIPAPKVTQDAVDLLQKKSWPGNVRQLQNVIRRLLFITDSTISEKVVELALSGQENSTGITPASAWQSDEIISWREMERKLKYDYFKFVREKTASDADAAKILGLAPPNYYRMCKELGLK